MDNITSAETSLTAAKARLTSSKDALEAAKKALEEADFDVASKDYDLASAKEKLERAIGLSYEEAYETGVTDPDFEYLNDYIDKVKDAETGVSDAQADLDMAQDSLASSQAAYREATAEYAAALADVAAAQETYNSYLALSGVGTHMEGDTTDAGNAGGTGTDATKAESPKTDDVSHTGAYAGMAAASVIAAGWAARRRKKLN